LKLARTDDDFAPGNLRWNYSDVILEIDKTVRFLETWARRTFAIISLATRLSI